MEMAQINLSALTAEQTRGLEEMRRRFKDVEYEEKNIPTSWFKLSDHTYLRYLVARKFKVDQAEKMLLDTLEFRRVWQPHLIKSTDEDIKLALETKLWRLVGFSKDGSPIQVSSLKYFDPSMYTEKSFLRCCIFQCECVMQQMVEHGWKSDRTDIVFDLEGFSMFVQGSPSAMNLTKKGLEIDDLHYPEVLGKSIVFNAPLMFRGVWAVIKPWLAQATLDRIIFVDDVNKLHHLIEPSILHERHGGIRTQDYPVYSDSLVLVDS
jgi:hypothetical protein